MILSEDRFSKGVIATTFMLGVVEFYVKHLLGFPQIAATKEDWEKQQKFRKTFIGKAICDLQNGDSDLAQVLNRIDSHSLQRLHEFDIQEDYWTRAKIVDRIALFRNSMVHGEAHYFYDKEEYLVLLYILFHFHDLRKLEMPNEM